MGKKIRLTESEIRGMVMDTVKKILKEGSVYDEWPNGKNNKYYDVHSDEYGDWYKEMNEPYEDDDPESERMADKWLNTPESGRESEFPEMGKEEGGARVMPAKKSEPGSERHADMFIEKKGGMEPDVVGFVKGVMDKMGIKDPELHSPEEFELFVSKYPFYWKMSEYRKLRGAYLSMFGKGLQIADTDFFIDHGDVELHFDAFGKMIRESEDEL